METKPNKIKYYFLYALFFLTLISLVFILVASQSHLALAYASLEAEGMETIANILGIAIEGAILTVAFIISERRRKFARLARLDQKTKKKSVFTKLFESNGKYWFFLSLFAVINLFGNIYHAYSNEVGQTRLKMYHITGGTDVHEEALYARMEEKLMKGINAKEIKNRWGAPDYPEIERRTKEAQEKLKEYEPVEFLPVDPLRHLTIFFLAAMLPILAIALTEFQSLFWEYVQEERDRIQSFNKPAVVVSAPPEVAEVTPTPPPKTTNKKPPVKKKVKINSNKVKTESVVAEIPKVEPILKAEAKPAEVRRVVKKPEPTFFAPPDPPLDNDAPISVDARNFRS